MRRHPAGHKRRASKRDERGSHDRQIESTAAKDEAAYAADRHGRQGETQGEPGGSQPHTITHDERQHVL